MIEILPARLLAVWMTLEDVGVGHERSAQERGAKDQLVPDPLLGLGKPQQTVLLAEPSGQTAAHLGSGLPHPVQLHGEPLRNTDVVSAHQGDQLATSLPHSDVLRRGPVTSDPLEHAYSRVLGTEATRHGDRPVGRAVVDDDQLPVVDGLALNRRDRFAELRFGVADRHHYGDEGCHGVVGLRPLRTDERQL